MVEEPIETPEEDLQPSAEEELPDEAGYIQIRRSHLYLALIPVALLLGLAGGYLIWGQDATAAPASETAASASGADGGDSQAGRIEIDPGDDPAFGPADAPITIVEFSDFNCAFCQRWHREVSQELFDAYPGQIRFVYKDFPIVAGGQVGFLAAQAAECANELGAYWEYHDALFSGEYVLDSSGVDQAAEDLGLDLESFKQCMVDARYADEVREDFEYGAALGISSTPTFFVNGIPVVGAQPLLRFMEIINSELGN